MNGRLAADLRRGLDPAELLRASGLDPEPWQTEVLRARPQRTLLLCSRQAGKSTTAAAAAAHEAIYLPGSLALMFAPTQRQSSELFRKARSLLSTFGAAAAFTIDSSSELQLKNGSRILSLPAREETIRGYSKVSLLIFDEAAWVADELYAAARPMLAVSDGRLLALSTPNGQRGWFYNEWSKQAHWHRVKIIAAQCPRISAEFLAEERRTHTAARYASEYECEFTDAIDAVFFSADIRAAVNPDLQPLWQGGW